MTIIFLVQYEDLARSLRKDLDENQIEDVYEAIRQFPKLKVEVSIKGPAENVFPVKKQERGMISCCQAAPIV